MRKIKFRYICKDVTGRIFTLFTDIEDLEQGRFNICSIGLIQGIVTRNLFTTILDKNGKEMYEGDVLGESGLGNLLVRIGLYDNGKSYEAHIGGYGWYLQNLQGEVFGITYIDLYKNHPIIGNIYENPELFLPKQGRKEIDNVSSVKSRQY